MPSESVIVVEGISDRAAVEALARKQGRDLAKERVAVATIGGAQAIAGFLDVLRPRAAGIRIAGLYDEGEERHFRRALERTGYGSDLSRSDLEELGFFVCVRDLEDELIRALGADGVLRVIEEHGDLTPFRTLQKQPEWRGRPVEEQLHRFMGSGGRRKTRYATYLVEALPLDRVPRPLARVLERV